MTFPVSAPSEEQIAELANRFWEEEGRPEGKAEEHWARAQEQIRNAGAENGQDAGAQQSAEVSATAGENTTGA